MRIAAYALCVRYVHVPLQRALTANSSEGITDCRLNVFAAFGIGIAAVAVTTATATDIAADAIAAAILLGRRYQKQRNEPWAPLTPQAASAGVGLGARHSPGGLFRTPQRQNV